jgi:hypothetical protein
MSLNAMGLALRQPPCKDEARQPDYARRGRIRLSQATVFNIDNTVAT